MADDGTKRHAPLTEYRRNYASKRRSSIEVLRINVEKNVKNIVLEDILPNLVTQHGVPTSNVIASCNVLCTFSPKIIDEAGDIVESVFRCFLPCLLHHVREVRTSALRAIRYLIRTNSHFEVFLGLHLDYLVARSLDLSNESSRPAGLHHLEQCENVQALRLIAHLLHVDPQLVPTTLIRPLIALVKESMMATQTAPGSTGANSEDNSCEQTARGCLLVLTELALLNPQIVHECGGVSVLLDSVLSSMLSGSLRIPEAMLLAILHLINRPDTRRMFPDCQFLERLISPLTSPSIYQLSLKNRKGSQETQLSEMRLASTALLLTLRSWSGLLYLCQPKSTGIRSLTDVLVVGAPELQKHLLDLLYDVFHIRKLSSESLTSFETALESIDSQAGCPTWSLQEGFVAEEGLSLLSYKSVSKMNLVDNHVSLLIVVFFSNGLIEGLCRLLVQSSSEELSIMSGILLAELMHLSSVLLAPDHPVSQSASRTLSLLLDNDQSRRVMHWLEQVHRLKEQTPQPYSPFLSFIISSACAPPAPIVASSANSASANASGGPSGNRINSISSVSGPHALSGWLGEPSEERPRHGSFSAFSQLKLIEALVDRAVAESGVLPPSHHRSSSSVSSSPPALAGHSGIDATSPDYWNWDQLLCTVRRLLDFMCPACAAGLGANAAGGLSAQVNVSSIVGHNLVHHSHLHHHHPHHHNQSHHSHDSRNNSHGPVSGSGPGMVSGSTPNMQNVPTTRLVSWDEPNRARFLRRLMSFFSLPPSCSAGTLASNSYSAQSSNSPFQSHQNLQRHHSATPGPGFFATRPYNWVWARKAATVATELFAFLALYPSESEPGGLLADVLSQFAAAVRRVCPNIPDDAGGSFYHDSTLAPGTLERTCSHFLFLPVCRLTWSERGEQLLESQGVTEALTQLITFTQCPLYIKLVVSSLDYSRPGSFSRLLLDRSTTACCEEGRVYVARFLRVLLRANLPFFSLWGIELAHKQVHDAYLPVSREALATLQEACEDPENLSVLARLKPALLHQNFAGHAVACRLLGSHPEFLRLKLKNWIKPELEEWTGNGSFVCPFVEHIEESLFEAMTSYTPPTQLGDDLDRLSSNPRKEAGRSVLAPMHPFGALAKHEEGMEFLKDSGYLEGALREIRNGPIVSRKSSPNDLHRLKAAIWSLGQLGSSKWGFDWLAETSAIQNILVLASDADVLSIRGHAFWCLGLVGSTPRGAELLRHHGWLALRSDRLDKWPLQLPQWERPRHGPAPGPSQRHPSAAAWLRDLRTDSLASSGDSRRSTFESAGAAEWAAAAWLGAGTGTVRSLGRDSSARALAASGPDVLGYATLGRLRGHNHPSLFGAGSAHDLDGCDPAAALIRHAGGSLSSLQGAAAGEIGTASSDDLGRGKIASSVTERHGFPTEYRGIALPLSCDVLSSNLYASHSYYQEESNFSGDDEEATQTDTDVVNDHRESVFLDETSPGIEIVIDKDVSSALMTMDGPSDASENSLSSASTSDYFSRTRSGSIGPLTVNHSTSHGDGMSSATEPTEQKRGAEEDEQCDGKVDDAKTDSSLDGGPDPSTGLELHSKKACIVCSCGREPTAEFSASMASPRMEVIDRVEKLMSHVHSRKHEIALLAMRERFPELLQDFCLFSEVALMLSNYRFNRAARTFLQEVFLELETASLYKLAQTVLPPLSEESDES